MIINDKTIKLKNRKLKKDKRRERWNKRRNRKRIKKVIKMLRKLYVKNNNVNVQLDSTLIAFDLKPVLDEMVEARLLTYYYQGSIYKIRILTDEDIFNSKKPTKKSSTTANIKNKDELETVDIKLDLDDSDEVEDANMFDEG